jgi:hypothetical protein
MKYRLDLGGVNVDWDIDVAQTMTSLGMDISRVVTLSDLQQGIKRCIQWSSEGSADRAR